MEKLFSPDSVFMRAMSRIGDLLILNFLFLLTSIPVVTIGAGATALYTVTFRFDTDNEAGIVGSYFRAFRANWKQATAIWLILLVCGGSAGLNAFLFYSMSGVFRYLAVLFVLLLALLLLTAGYTFPLLSQFDNRVMTTLKKGTKLFYLGQSGAYYKVCSEFSYTSGYVYKGYVSYYGAVAYDSIFRCNGKTALYSRPTSSSHRTATLKNGQFVIVRAVSGKWAYIYTISGKKGYVRTSQLKDID